MTPSRVDLHGILLVNDGGQARMSFVGDEEARFVWSWPCGVRSAHTSFGEDLAKALALVDGTFEVRRLRDTGG